MKRWNLVPAGLLFTLFTACGGGGGGTPGPGTNPVDTSYNFTAAGVQPGVNTRQNGRATLQGQLLDSTGAPVTGITVTLFRLTDGSGVPGASRQAIGSISTTSGGDGRYVFGDVPPWQYRLQVQTQTLDVTAVADTDVPANFTNVAPAGGGGGGGGGDDPGAGAPGPTRHKWTLIILMNADNDLEAFGVQDINEMEQLADNEDVAIVVLMDRTRGFDSTNNNWTDARRFRVRHDDNPTLMTSARSPAEGGSAEVLGEIDTGSVSVVNGFIQWAMTNYPAERYLFDFWNHGSGWRKRNLADHPLGRGVLFDDTQGTFISTPQLSQVMTTPDWVDLTIFDSSLMQMMEVAYQIRNQTTFVVGSEESPPGEGYPYDRIFSLPISNPSVTPEAFASHIVNTTVDSLGGSYQLTQSALRANQLEPLAASISAFADLLRAKDLNYHSQIAAARAATQRYGSGSAFYEGNRDLLDFADEVVARTQDPELSAARDALAQALSLALVAERHTGSGLADSHGLAIFAPDQSGWTSLRTSYLQTAFGQNARWAAWLDDFYDVP